MTDEQKQTKGSGLARLNVSPKPQPKETKDFVEAKSDVYELLEELIYQTHPSILSHLIGHQFKILMRKKPSYSKGQRILGSIRLYPERDQLVHPYSGLIILDKTFWETQLDKREPLLFHELCHVQEDEAGKLVTVNHDIEEFYAVIRHYGDWLNETKRMSEQLNLFALGEADRLIEDFAHATQQG